MVGGELVIKGMYTYTKVEFPPTPPPPPKPLPPKEKKIKKTLLRKKPLPVREELTEVVDRHQIMIMKISEDLMITELFVLLVIQK